MRCYHATTSDRLASILEKGLLPNSEPTWFDEPAPYIMLAKEAWTDLNGPDIETVMLEVTDPRIKEEYFDDPEGLRWPYRIAPEYLGVVY